MIRYLQFTIYNLQLSIAGLSVRIDLLVIFIIVFLLALYTNLKTGSFV